MDLLQKIREAFANLQSLTAEQLTGLRADVLKCGKEFDAGDALENAKVLSELADIGEAVTGRLSAIKQEQEQAEQQTQAARDRLAQITGENEGEPEDKPEDAAPEGAETPVEEPVAAGGFKSSPSAMRTRTTPSPELGDAEDPKRIKVICASAELSKPYGAEFSDSMDLARTIGEKLSRMDRRASSGGRVTIASAQWLDKYDEEHHLRGDFGTDNGKLDRSFRTLSRRRKNALGLAPIAASGGVPLPTNVDYAMDTWASADRPVRAGLDPYAVDRGGLIYRQPPTLAALADATTIWTNANDIDPTDPTTKPVLQISPQDTTQVYISAVPTRLGFGNLMGQFDPETIAANTDLAIAAAARIAELNLISTIAGFSVMPAAKSQTVGASRDLFQTIVQVAAAYRFQFRLARDLPLNIMLPSWALDIFKADRIWELAHDSAGSLDVFAIDDDYIERALNVYDLYPIWTMEGLPLNSAIAGPEVEPYYVSQNFTAFSQNGTLPAFPTALVWFLWIRGGIQFIDGGRLDLGVVRDSTLDATNDYETFVETFENAANRMFTGGVIGVVSDLLPNGVDGGTVEIAAESMTITYSIPTPVPAIPPLPPQLSLLSCAITPPSGEGDVGDEVIPLDLLPVDLKAELDLGATEKWIKGYGYLPRNQSAAMNRDRNDVTTVMDPFTPPNLLPVLVVPWAAICFFTLTSLDWDAEDFQARAEEQLDAAIPAALEDEFWTGTLAQAYGYPNNYLAGPRTVDITPSAPVAGYILANEIPNGGAGLPVTVTTGSNDQFVFTSTDNDVNSPDTFALPPGAITTIAELAAAANAALSTTSGLPFSDYVTVTVDGTKLLFTEVIRGTNANGDTITEGNGGAAVMGVTTATFAHGGAGTAVSVLEGLGKLQTALRGKGQGMVQTFGGQGMIHVTPEAVPNLLNSRRVGKYLLDMMDNIIIPGVGYPGTGPLVDPPASGTTWMYATDLVKARVQKQGRVFPGSFAEALDRSQGGYPNTITFRAEKFIAADFDGARQFAILVELPS